MHRLLPVIEREGDVPRVPPVVAGPWGTVVARSTLEALLEYSASLPTGTRIGKVWKRYVCEEHPGCGRWCSPNPKSCRGRWVLGEYFDLGDPERVGIRWHRPIIVADTAIARHISLARWCRRLSTRRQQHAPRPARPRSL